MEISSANPAPCRLTLSGVKGLSGCFAISFVGESVADPGGGAGGLCLPPPFFLDFFFTKAKFTSKN